MIKIRWNGGMKMKHARILLAVSFVVFVSCAASTIPLPKDLEIISPKSDVPAEVKAFSGTWHGIWDGVLEHVLVVEKVEPPNVMVVYGYGVAPSWYIKEAGAYRVQGQIEPGILKLILRRPATVTYRMKSDGTLDATYEWSGGVARANMKRVE
jgi:hypothetical protein